MKRIPLLLLLAVMLLPAGCSEGGILPDPDYPIVDWYPVNVVMTVQDRYGNDLLDPTREDALVHGTTLTFKGEKFGVQSNLNAPSVSMPSTKYYLARIKGLLLCHGLVQLSETETRTCYYLVFGELDGAKEYDDDLTVRWADGSEDVIHYYCANHSIKKNADGTWDITCDRSWKLNKKEADPPFQFVK